MSGTAGSAASVHGVPGAAGDNRGGDAAQLLALLGAAGSTLAVAESLTGGAVTDALVAVPGASRVLRGGVVAYATDLKVSLLDVPADLLETHGAVHPDVARAMASGVRHRLGADYGLATTGAAGPEPLDGRAPGTVHIAVEGPWGGEVVSLALDPGDGREVIRARARDAALALGVRRAAVDLAARR